jgi:hypothetical protein
VANADDEQHRSFDRPGRIIATASGGKTAGCLTTARRTRMALQIRRVRARGGLEHCQLWLLRARAADLRMPVGVATLNGTLCYIGDYVGGEARIGRRPEDPFTASENAAPCPRRSWPSSQEEGTSARSSYALTLYVVLLLRRPILLLRSRPLALRYTLITPRSVLLSSCHCSLCHVLEYSAAPSSVVVEHRSQSPLAPCLGARVPRAFKCPDCCAPNLPAQTNPSHHATVTNKLASAGGKSHIAPICK